MQPEIIQKKLLPRESVLRKSLLRKLRGFTLVELMIVIAIIGILAAVGYPAYTSAVKKGNRAEAISSLMTLAGAMEDYYINNGTYVGATVTTLLGSTTSAEGLYTISLSGQTAYYYLMTAAPVTTDADCGNLSLDSIGVKSVSAGTVTACW